MSQHRSDSRALHQWGKQLSEEKPRQHVKPDPRPTGDDAFALTDMYPNAAALFEHQSATIAEISTSSFVALDANVLLWPYEFNSASLAEVDRVYGLLRKKRRLVVPGQAAREFYKHRARKLASLSENIDGTIARANKSIFQNAIPILQDDPNYEAARELGATIAKSSQELVKKLECVKARLQSDVGSDPISSIYRKHFTSSVIEIDFAQDDRHSILLDAERRTRLRIAPGFKDQSKEDGGIGDLIIWKTILQEAGRRKGNCLFVTNEEKSDWWVKSGGAFQPRPELLDEYRRASNGGSLHLLPLSELLSLFAAKREIVQDVQDLEEASRQREQEKPIDVAAWIHRRAPLENSEILRSLHVRRNEYADRLGAIDRQLDNMRTAEISNRPTGYDQASSVTRNRLQTEKRMLLREMEACATEIATAQSDLAQYASSTSLNPMMRLWINERANGDDTAS